jgi:hypothetical protein
MTKLNPNIVCGLLQAYEAIEPSSLEQMEVTKDDLELLSSPNLWTAPHRRKARRALEMLCNGALVVTGLPLHEQTAELKAALIAKFVNTANHAIASHIMCETNTRTAEEIELGNEAPLVRPSHLQALVQQALANLPAFNEKLAKRVNQAVNKAPKE